MGTFEHHRILENTKVSETTNNLRHTIYETQEVLLTGNSCRDMMEDLRLNGISAWEPCFDDELEELESALRDPNPAFTFFSVKTGDEQVVIRCASASKLIRTLEELREDRMRQAGSAYTNTVSSQGSSAKN